MRIILKTNPSDTDALLFRARLYLAEDKIQKAVEDLSMITRNATRFAPGFYFLGQAQLKQGQSGEAKKSFTKAVELSPNWIDPILSLAQVNLAIGIPIWPSSQLTKSYVSTNE